MVWNERNVPGILKRFLRKKFLRWEGGLDWDWPTVLDPSYQTVDCSKFTARDLKNDQEVMRVKVTILYLMCTSPWTCCLSFTHIHSLTRQCHVPSPKQCSNPSPPRVIWLPVVDWVCYYQSACFALFLQPYSKRCSVIPSPSMVKTAVVTKSKNKGWKIDLKPNWAALAVRCQSNCL